MARFGLVAARSIVVIAVGANAGCGSDTASPVVNENEIHASDAGAGASDQAPNDGRFGSGGPSPEQPDSGATPIGNVGGVSPGAACATSSAGADPPSLHLVFMVDRSASMGDSDNAWNEALRWKPVKAGLKAFFADNANVRVRASIAFFGQGDSNPNCAPSAYAAPSVAMTTLPNATAFAAALDATSPGGKTPTYPAVSGAVAYAQSLRTTVPAGDKVAIVLATDGVPEGCSSSTSNTAAVAASVAATIPTYVIGVGPQTGNLDTIAAGGGTANAIMIATSNPPQVSNDLRAALGTIAAKQLECTYVLPSPPAGEALDLNAVNVTYTPAGAAAQTLTYSADCANPNGWHYDSTTAPKHVVMCPGSCDTLEADTTGGKLHIVFGCAIAAKPGEPLPGGGIK